MKIIALMSGSSLDGLDIGYVEITNKNNQFQWQLINKTLSPYSHEWKTRLLELPKVDALAYVETKAAYSMLISEKVINFIQQHNIKPDLISWHGHTIFHNPAQGFSEQIGEGGIMAALTGIQTITDFRITDIALNGQGTPIAPIVEKHLFPGNDYYLNLGGIANISIHNTKHITAYDICPANQLLNHLCTFLNKEYDKDGLYSRKGNSNPKLLNDLLNFDYYNIVPPKSIDNNWVRKEYFPLLNKHNISIEDKLSTTVDFIVDTIFNSLKKEQSQGKTNKTKTLLATGGGTHNLYLIELLKEKLNSINIKLIVPSEEIIDYKETILMALMGYLRISKDTNTLSSVTGASKDTIGGAVYLP